MKRARLLVTVDMFIEALKGGGLRHFEVVNHQIPDDARVVDVAYIHSERTIAIDLESETFNEMPPKAPHPPVLSTPEVRVVRLTDEAAKDAAAKVDAAVDADAAAEAAR